MKDVFSFMHIDKRLCIIFPLDLPPLYGRPKTVENKGSNVRYYKINITFPDWMIVYKYNILERVIVENIIPRNVINNRGAAEVDNHIFLGMIFQLSPSLECYVYFIIPNIIPFYFFYLFSL